MEKKCFRCEVVQPATPVCFSRNNSKKDKLDHICKNCRARARLRKRVEKVELTQLSKVKAVAWDLLVERLSALPELRALTEEVLAYAEVFCSAPKMKSGVNFKFPFPEGDCTE